MLHPQSSLEFIENGKKKEKNFTEQPFSERKSHVDERDWGETPDWFTQIRGSRVD